MKNSEEHKTLIHGQLLVLVGLFLHLTVVSLHVGVEFKTKPDTQVPPQVSSSKALDAPPLLCVHLVASHALMFTLVRMGNAVKPCQCQQI